MTNSQTAVGVGVWEPAQSPLVIHYDTSTLQRINRDVLTAFRSLPHGGLGIGGVLFGTVENNRVMIRGFETIACEHAAGPSFVLSETDKASLEQKLLSLRERLDAEGQRVVGWYRSHTRSALAMSTDDLTLHYRFFAEPWQVALMLKPQGPFSSRAGFFVREKGAAAMRTSSSYLEFTLEADPHDAFAPPPPPRETAVERHRPAPPAWREVPQVELAAAQRFPTPPPEQSQRTRWTIWATLAAMFVLAMSAIGYMRMFYSSGEPPKTPGHIRLDAQRKDGNLEVSWDTKDLAGATQAKLDIQDGGLRAQLTLDRPTLMSGAVSYAVKSDVTGFNLTVDRPDGSVLSGSTTYIASDSSAPQSAAAEPEPTKPERARKDEPAKSAANIHTAEPDKIAPAPDPTDDAADRAKAPPLIEPRALSAAEIVSAPGAPLNLRGSWALQPGASTRSPALPESVNIRITDRDGAIHGTFDGRYRTSDSAGAKIDRLSFSFSGRIENGVARFPWAGNDGERGQIEFIRHSGDMLEVVFYGPDAKVYDHVVHKVR